MFGSFRCTALASATSKLGFIIPLNFSVPLMRIVTGFLKSTRCSFSHTVTSAWKRLRVVGRVVEADPRIEEVLEAARLVVLHAAVVVADDRRAGAGADGREEIRVMSAHAPRPVAAHRVPGDVDVVRVDRVGVLDPLD